MEAEQRFEKVNMTAVTRAHPCGEITVVTTHVKDHRGRRQRIIDAQRVITLGSQPKTVLGDELVLSQIAVIKGGEPPLIFSPLADWSRSHAARLLMNAMRPAAIPYVIDQTSPVTAPLNMALRRGTA